MTKANAYRQLVDKLAGLGNPQTLHPKWLFRGQTNSQWTLNPSFTRIAKKRGLDRPQALQLEREAVSKFSVSGSKVLPLEYTIDLTLSRFKSPDGHGIDFMGWWAVMQHDGAPTRTLDWSCSPWVALYFACCERHELDGALWVADFTKVTECAEKALPKMEGFSEAMTQPCGPDILAFMMAYNTNQRIEAQQARFSVCTNPLGDHRAVIEEAEALEKIEIPKELKPRIMTELNQMNISAKTLFPGIDGLGRSITEYCNLWDKSSIIK